MLRLLVPLLLSCCLLPGCNTGRLIANSMGSTMEAIRQAYFEDESPAHSFQAGPALLMQMDGLIRNSPENEDLLYFGASMNCGFAMTFLDHRDRAWAAAEWRKGLGYALRGLEQVQPELAAAVRAGDEAEVARLLKAVEVEDISFVFWSGACWGGLINAMMDETEATNLPMTELLITRAHELDPKYYFAAGDLFFGMMNAGRSEMLGGDLEKGKVHFEKSIELTDGKFLLTRVFFAKTYAVNKQDPDLFVKLLNEVVADSSEAPADMRMANAVAREMAAELLTRVGDFFPGYEGKTMGEPDVELLEEDDVDLDLD